MQLFSLLARRILATFGLVLITITLPAQAEDTSAIALDIIELMHFDEQVEAQIQTMPEQITRMVTLQMAGEIDAADLAIIEKYQVRMLEEGLRAVDWDAVRARMAGVYARVFTVDELSGLRDFLKSPAGQAFALKNSEVTQGIFQAIQPEIGKMMPVIRQISEELREELSH